MAGPYYWVGGTGNWNDPTNHWSTSSGGAPGAGNTPTATDDVNFDVNSAGANYTVTVNAAATCKSMTWANPSSGTPTMAGTFSLSISGSLTLVSGMGWTKTSTVNFLSSGAETITMNTKAINNAVTFDGTGSWQLQDTFNIGANSVLTLTKGTLDTNGQSVTAGRFASPNGQTRALTLGASSLLFDGNSGVSWSVGSTLSLTANTSTITIQNTNNNAVFTGGGLTYYNVVMTSITSTTRPLQMNDANTFNNLTINGGSTTSSIFTLSANQTVNGTFSGLGSSAANRTFINSSVTGTTRTITAAVASLQYIDFEDITGAGAATWSGTSIGNLGGNSNITFASPVTRYWIANGGDSNDTAHWSTSDGGSSGASIPLAQDTAYFTSNSFSSGSQTINWKTRAVPKVDFTGVTNTPTFSLNLPNFTGSGNNVFTQSVTLAGNVPVDRNGAPISIEARDGSTITITSNGSAFTFAALTIISPGSTVSLADNFLMTNGSASLTHTMGTLTAAGNVDMQTFSITGTGTRTLNMGNGTWTMAGIGTIWDATDPTNLTLNANGSTLLSSSTSASARTFASGGKTYSNVTFAGSGAGLITVSGGPTLTGTMSILNPPRSIKFTVGTTTTVAGFVATGTAGNEITINSTTTGVFNIVKTGVDVVSCDYLNLQHSAATPANTWYAGTHSTNNQGVATAGSGWIFTDPPVAGGGVMVGFPF